MRYLFVLFLTLSAFAVSEPVRLVAPAYEPYYGPNLPNQGPVTQIIREAFTLAGREVSVEFLPWMKAMELARSGRYDGIFTLWYAQKRKQWFYFSDGLFPNVIGFFKRKGLAFHFSKASDLEPYQVGIVDGFAYPTFIQDGHFQVIKAPNDKANIQNLCEGKLDVIVVDRLLAQNVLQKLGPSCLRTPEWVNPELEMRQQYIGISKQGKDSEKILWNFNQGLQLLRASGRFEEILRQHGLYETLSVHGIGKQHRDTHAAQLDNRSGYAGPQAAFLGGQSAQ